MTPRRVFVPGKFPSANHAIELARREGVALAQRRMLPSDGYTSWAYKVRQLGMLHGKAARLPPLPAGVRVDVAVHLVGHHRLDADAWTAAGKWLVDGLRDAGVLGSDRKDVREVGGRCFATDEEEEEYLAERGIDTRRAGALVELTEVHS